MDSQVRDLRDQFVTRAWSRQLYNGLYFSPEREFAENSVIFSQHNVTGQVKMMAYKGNVRHSEKFFQPLKFSVVNINLSG